MKVSLSERAYVKLALHAAKHPTRDALGALVGRVRGEDVEVTDALPMTHTPLSVTPTVEIALEQFAHHAALDGDQTLVGAYLANERAEDVGFGTNPSAVADVIEDASRTRTAVALVVDAAKLHDALDHPDTAGTHGLILMRKTGKTGSATKWETVGNQAGTLVVASAAIASASRLLKRRDAAKKMVDFDDHLDDPARDWRNPGLDGMLAE